MQLDRREFIGVAASPLLFGLPYDSVKVRFLFTGADETMLHNALVHRGLSGATSGLRGIVSDYEGSIDEARKLYSGLFSAGFIPVCRQSSQILEDLVRGLMGSSDYLARNFEATRIEDIKGVTRVNYRSLDETPIEFGLGVLPRPNGQQELILTDYATESIDGRVGDAAYERWWDNVSKPFYDVKLETVNKDDTTTIGRLDVGGIRAQLLQGIRKQKDLKIRF